MTAFNRSYQLTEKDLYINLKNNVGAPVDPHSLTYSIFDNTTGTAELISPPNRHPRRVSTGSYFADFAVDPAANTGNHLIQWYIQETPTSPDELKEEVYTVVGLNVETLEPEIEDYLQDFVTRLRVFLRDNNPDRNYHFRPPTDQNVIRGYTSNFGYIWETYELVIHLECAAEYLSLTPPQQTISLQSYPYGYKTLILMQAAVLAIRALTLNWIEEEYGYSIGGISLDLDKSSKYSAMADTLANQVDATLEKAKLGIKITKGIQQSHFRAGAQGVLGPYTGRGSTNPRNWVGRSLGRPGG